MRRSLFCIFAVLLLGCTKDTALRVMSPEPHAVVSEEFTITGEARGWWFFEASFPILLLDADGKEIGRALGEAQEEWMTEDFVPFRATMRASFGGAEEGMLVLQRDNPSGLPDNDAEIRIPLRFGRKLTN